MGLKGKGFYIWQIKRIAGGDPVAIAESAQKAGLSHVVVKIADGKYGYNFLNGVDLVEPLVAALRARNIAVWAGSMYTGPARTRRQIKPSRASANSTWMALS